LITALSEASRAGLFPKELDAASGTLTKDYAFEYAQRGAVFKRGRFDADACSLRPFAVHACSRWKHRFSSKWYFL